MSTGTPDILRKIVEVKRDRLILQKEALPMSGLLDLISEVEKPLNFVGRLMGERVRVIAEVKRASPSKGLFKENLDAGKLARTYAENGAAAVSVLTNEDYFKGSIEDMLDAHSAIYALGVPILRKEFIFDPYQIYEARAFGADAILLIVSMLDGEEIREFMEIARSLWMQCLVEVHDENELATALSCNPEIVGINNRDLHSFETTLEVTERIAPMIPFGTVSVSESGITGKNDLERVRSLGVSAVLVGESLVRSPDPGKALRELV